MKGEMKILKKLPHWDRLVTSAHAGHYAAIERLIGLDREHPKKAKRELKKVYRSLDEAANVIGQAHVARGKKLRPAGAAVRQALGAFYENFALTNGYLRLICDRTWRRLFNEPGPPG